MTEILNIQDLETVHWHGDAKSRQRFQAIDLCIEQNHSKYRARMSYPDPTYRTYRNTKDGQAKHTLPLDRPAPVQVEA